MSERYDWVAIAEQCCVLGKNNTMNLDMMAQIAVERNLVRDLSFDDVRDRIRNSLHTNSGNGKRAKFTKLKNPKTGKARKGWYKLRTATHIKVVRSDEQVTANKLYTGKAGEYAVFSELLFREFNASLMAVDDGIDIVASKNNHHFYIQVKAANGDEFGPYTTSILQTNFKHQTTTFYVMVLRRKDKERFYNDYLILTSQEVRSVMLYDQADKKSISLTVRIEKRNGVAKYILNGHRDVTLDINDFGKIA